MTVPHPAAELKTSKAEEAQLSGELVDLKEKHRSLSTQYEITLHDRDALTKECTEKNEKIANMKTAKKV